MNLLLSIKSLCALCYLATLPALYAHTVHLETNDGDLSSNIYAPTSLGSLTLGENLISGSINEGGTPFNPDVFTFFVPDLLEWTGLEITVSTQGYSHFLALDEGTTAEYDAASLLIATLISDASATDNILITDADGGSFFGSGLEDSLSGKHYTLWLQETTIIPKTNTYLEFDYTIKLTTVPEPSALLLISLGSLPLVTRRSRGSVAP